VQYDIVYPVKIRRSKICLVILFPSPAATAAMAATTVSALALGHSLSSQLFSFGFSAATVMAVAVTTAAVTNLNQ